jgi:hypothetical protein
MRMHVGRPMGYCKCARSGEKSVAGVCQSTTATATNELKWYRPPSSTQHSFSLNVSPRHNASCIPFLSRQLR